MRPVTRCAPSLGTIALLRFDGLPLVASGGRQRRGEEGEKDETTEDDEEEEKEGMEDIKERMDVVVVVVNVYVRRSHRPRWRLQSG
eukprot:2092721-Pyramimonas_sp.AAC.1